MHAHVQGTLDVTGLEEGDATVGNILIAIWRQVGAKGLGNLGVGLPGVFHTRTTVSFPLGGR